MEISDIEVGKYYWLNNISHRWIIKITKVDGRKIWGPCITIEDKFPSYYDDRRWGTFQDEYSIKKATQEQIDHLDACIAAGKYVEAPEKPKFEVGKWYKITLEGRYNHYFKFKKINGGVAYIDDLGYIADLKRWSKGLSISLSSVTSSVLITDLQEIQQYLPEDHPDRIDTVPEYVECLEDYRDQFTKGKIYKTGSYFGSVTEDDQGDKNGWGKEKFKPSTREAYLAQQGKSEELTELPEKWCLKVTSENAGTLNQQSWYDISYAHRIIGRYICGDYFDFRHHSAESYGTEITFEQFKKWVLKEEKSIESWSVGTYVVIIKPYHSVKVGEVHQIDSEDPSYVQIDRSVGCACWPPKDGLKWFATKEEAEKFAETLRDKPLIELKNNHWYEVEDGYGEYYIARYNGGFHCSEIINDGKYETDVDVEGNGEYRIIAEIPSDDPKITRPLWEYAKKKYLLDMKVNSPALGNSESSHYKGFNGEKSFELVKEESKLEEANRRFKVGMKIKTPTYQKVITLNEGSFPTQFINGDVCTGCGNYILYDADLDKWATVISEEKVEESWTDTVMKDLEATGWMTHTIDYKEPIVWQSVRKESSDLLDVVIDVPITIGE